MTAREVMWRRVMDDASVELARLDRTPDGILITGIVLVAEQERPMRVDYTVGCDDRWRTRRASIVLGLGGDRRTLTLERAADEIWRIDGSPAPALDGCTDVDIGVTPSTNALPVNRLGLAVGEAGTIRAAWVRFPALDVVPAEQRYERLDERRYRYRSLTSGFEAVVEVDADGLPVDYAGIWRRTAEGPAAA